MIEESRATALALLAGCLEQQRHIAQAYKLAWDWRHLSAGEEVTVGGKLRHAAGPVFMESEARPVIRLKEDPETSVPLHLVKKGPPS